MRKRKLWRSLLLITNEVHSSVSPYNLARGNSRTRKFLLTYSGVNQPHVVECRFYQRQRQSFFKWPIGAIVASVPLTTTHKFRSLGNFLYARLSSVVANSSHLQENANAYRHSYIDCHKAGLGSHVTTRHSGGDMGNPGGVGIHHLLSYSKMPATRKPTQILSLSPFMLLVLTLLIGNREPEFTNLRAIPVGSQDQLKT
jgi:hypothetical protein